jgi:uncharacterized protein
MRRVFADTSYWTALLSPRDELHQKAIAISERLGTVEIVTSEMVLVEVLNSFSKAGPPLRTLATSLVHALSANRFAKVVPQTPEIFEKALQRYKRAMDKSWSLTDCASFEIMEAEHVQAAITYDKHFVQAGYEALLR